MSTSPKSKGLESEKSGGGLPHSRTLPRKPTHVLIPTGFGLRQSSAALDANLPPGRPGSAFTLIELLVVIAIIAILAAMTLTAVHQITIRRQVTQAKLDMLHIETAIHEYESSYGRFPLARELVASSMANNADADFTFGTTALTDVPTPFQTPAGNWPVKAQDVNGIGLTEQRNNSEVTAILMDLVQYGDSTPTRNANHVMNTGRAKLLNAPMVSYTTLPGVGPDGVFRDPWKQPYVITLDANNDQKVRDPLYRLRAVSQLNGQTGLNGLVNSKDPGGNGDHFEIERPIAIWSAGPDAKIDPTKPANQGVNKDNVISWGQ